jgi:hypothetical protein
VRGTRIATNLVCAASTALTLVAGAAVPTAAEFRTAWGDPDLQGIWSNATLTPLERPDTEDRELLTEAEAAELNRTGLQRTLDSSTLDAATSGESSEAWVELGQGVRSRRTSLIVDPPSGRVPYTARGAQQRRLAMARLMSLVPIRSWEDRPVGERCLGTGGLLLPNPLHLNNHQIFQAPGYVAIKSEFMNETRIVPLDGRSPPAPAIKLWSGASRGRWEGDSLVVETTNFNGRSETITATTALRLVERFTRIDAATIDYELTVTDPDTYTQPWTLANTLRAIEGPIYEYACHEGNYSLGLVLAGAVAEEKAWEGVRRRQELRSRGMMLGLITLVALLFLLVAYRRGRR